MKFYLGTHKAGWLGISDYPLFLSIKTLRKRRTFPRAKSSWVLDSGAFTELATFGEWTIKPEDYAKEVKLYSNEIGNMDWASCQDWICDPSSLAKTGKSIKNHQRYTLNSYLDLKNIDPDLKIAPILQGWEPDDFLRHIEMYGKSGIDLTKEVIVGVGSVARRQHTDKARDLMKAICDIGINIHAFGFKMKGLVKAKNLIASSDSISWAMDARRRPPLDGCPHKNCANCIKYATMWRNRLMNMIGETCGKN